MAKHAILVMVDVDANVLDSTPVEEVEKITKNKIRILLNGRKGLKVTRMSTKYLMKLEE